ncbi:hypothetical protein K435DRAFT_966693 [Dendrothele bispora CBS 962.96]|uniref:Uncharacterized protein n=1 Tax=Dendrothele bispora (strain CBS 962.96) TaxID=1314807 RepID=A0A4V4HFG4_DENBC|nr:hypothetical protein K435DRAFT_966693 [Dendrothele bispora CBS 962.96]
MSSELEPCLASLDNSPPTTHINSSKPPPSLQTLDFVLNTPSKQSGRSRRYVPSPLSGKYAENAAATFSRTSSFSGSIIVGRESRSSVNPGNPTASPPFLPLPPILSEPSVELRSFMDFTFQSFSLSTPPGTRSSTPAQPPLPSLSQPLFTPPSPKPRPVLQLSTLNHPNSPYVPWDSPVRREIFRPLTPESFVSDFSQYSRPHSRSGARAPEPTELPEAENGRPYSRLPKLSQSIRNIRRSMKRNVVHVAKRITHLSRARSKSLDNLDVLPSSPSYVLDMELPPCPRPSSPCASVDTSNTRSVALWLESRRQDRYSRDLHFISLEDYERRGSWIDLPNGEQYACDVEGCPFHSQLPDTSLISGSSATPHHENPSRFKDDSILVTAASRLSFNPNNRPPSPLDLSLQSGNNLCRMYKP